MLYRKNCTIRNDLQDIWVLAVETPPQAFVKQNVFDQPRVAVSMGNTLWGEPKKLLLREFTK